MIVKNYAAVITGDISFSQLPIKCMHQAESIYQNSNDYIQQTLPVCLTEAYSSSVLMLRSHLDDVPHPHLLPNSCVQ